MRGVSLEQVAQLHDFGDREGECRFAFTAEDRFAGLERVVLGFEGLDLCDLDHVERPVVLDLFGEDKRLT